MMTSVTLPSSSGPIHSSGYSSNADAEEAIPIRREHDFEAPRPIKRCFQSSTSISNETCKKRRKQSTPVRISAEDKLLGPPSESELHCPVCQLVCNDQEQLQNHVALEHVNIDCKKEPEEPSTAQPQEPLENQMELLPSRSGSDLPWMADMQNKEWMNTSLLPFSPTNQMFMTLPPFTQPDTIPQRQQIRIFNPDAYCELCNKEFCNKYFLKTHKANKHGIYSDTPSSEPLSTSVNIPSYTTNIKLPGALTNPDMSVIKTLKVNKIGVYPPDLAVSETAGSSGNFGTNLDVAINKTEPKPQPNIITQFPDIFPFQSKLFPKLNKLSIPGLYEQDSELTTQVSSSSNGVSNEESEKNISEEPTEETSSSPKTDLTSFKTEGMSDQDTLFYTSPSKLSPGQQAREMDLSLRYKRIGVMNPKAFCEICCKEYCNKYFLRTHKMKRHGIFIPEDGKDSKMEGLAGMAWSQNMQTSPLNLIMTEQNNSSSSFSDRKTSSPPDISCDQCGIKFQNASLAQLHNVSVHAKLTPMPQENADANLDDKKSESSVVSEKIMSSADTISEDLQKLQTLVLQLNDLDVSKANTTCSSCHKEFENRFSLHAHMMTEHGLLLDEVVDNEKNEDAEGTINNNTMCEICGKDLQSVEDMKKHISEYHVNKVPTDIKDEYNNFVAPDKGASRTPVPPNPLGDRRTSMSLTPTSSYCEICNKELCNKYFMKTHMQRMHGIEIENGAQIGGVVCDICNKELCSKYFLRVHKHNTHGIVEYGSNLLQPRKGEDPQPPHLPAEPDPALKPTDLADLSHRYFTHFTEVCTICSRRFRSTKWLKAHLLSDHGQTGAEKWSELEQQLHQTMGQPNKQMVVKGERVSPTLKIPNGGQENPQKIRIQNVLSSIFGTDDANTKTYHCSYCTFSTSVLPFLFVHERSHSLQSQQGEGDATIKCPVCPQTFLQAELFQHHMFAQHPFLPVPPLFNGIGMEASGDASKEPSESADVEDGKGDDGRDCGRNDGGRGEGGRSETGRGDGLRGDAGRGDCGRGEGIRGDGIRGDGIRGDGIRGDGIRGDGIRGDGIRGDGIRVDGGRGDGTRGDCGRGEGGKGDGGKGDGGRGDGGRAEVGRGENGRGEGGRMDCGRIDDGGPTSDKKSPIYNLNNNKSTTNKKVARRKLFGAELSPEVGQSLKDVAKKTHLPATYALPQGDGDDANSSGIGGVGNMGGYVMQAFLVDETVGEERRFAPSVVFLPVLQRQSVPFSVTFNLTPA